MDFENILSQLLMNNKNAGENMEELAPMENKTPNEKLAPMEKKAPNEKLAPMEKMAPKEELAPMEKMAPNEKLAPMEEMNPMEKMGKKTEPEFVRGAEMGDLPCNAPIAMTYTPMQRKGSRKFSAGEALDRGTLFPGLELPLMNNFAVRNVANTPLGEIQALDFVLVELALYLDTHRTDTEAFQLFKQYARAYQDKKAAYVRTYGPIEKVHTAEADHWSWVDDPWPWDYTDRR